jgi:[glutamine synthetase] adenylyltransferase / [glutamine synthetase]-adenylyl-L-tyrosine phosphorylase
MQGKFDESHSMVHSFAQALGCADPLQAEQSLQSILDLGPTIDLFENFCGQLAILLPTCGDADRVLLNLRKYIQVGFSAHSLLALFEREPESLASLVKLFSASQYMADQLIANPTVYEMLRLTDGQPIQAGRLTDELMAEVRSTGELRQAMRAIRGFRHREHLRIAYGDIIGGLPVETVTQQLSDLASAILQAALYVARRELGGRRQPPLRHDRQPARLAVIALGMLGGAEMNYSSEIELIFVRDETLEPSNTRSLSSADYFERMASTVIKVLSEPMSNGLAYDVDTCKRPGGTHSPQVISITEGLQFYDSSGRTWQRQAFIKARVVAGDLELGNSFLEQLQPWIFRRYLNRADIAGIAALKRRIEKQTAAVNDNQRNVKLAAGAIRDVEFAIQFMQLLNGGDIESVRAGNTLNAIQVLELAGCLTAEESQVLSTNYRFLRRIEHYLQIVFDISTKILPSDANELNRLAMQLDYRESVDGTELHGKPHQQLLYDWQEKTKVNQRILNHLLHEAYADDEAVSPETDLVLDPEPSETTIVKTLSPHGFRDPTQAYRNLMELSRESISFLSTRRCRHFFSAIAPRLLSAISATPNPDATLVNLANISQSLGGKAILWELFMANAPSMELVVRLCASSPYLVGILTSNPGMIDELLDSLMLDCLPTYDELEDHLDELCRGATDISPMLHSFKNSMHLRVGVRDILGKEEISTTHATLSDIAEVCLKQVIQAEYHRLVQRLGVPVLTEGERSGQTAELCVLAVGKLGGREPNYHSDLDVIFLFDGDGHTQSLLPSRKFEPTSNRHFFNQLCQRIIHAVTRTGTQGRLYDLDVQLRPLGSNGELAITIDDLHAYFAGSAGRAWERQALCKARAIWGSPIVRESAVDCVQSVLSSTAWTNHWAEEIFEHRLQLEKNASRNNIKRAAGGTMDIEFVVQMLQMQSAATHPNVLVPRTLDAIERLRIAGKLDAETALQMSENYRFLRSIESGLRLMNTSARHDLPTGENELERLAFLIQYRESLPLGRRCQEIRRVNREIFDRVFSPMLALE